MRLSRGSPSSMPFRRSEHLVAAGENGTGRLPATGKGLNRRRLAVHSDRVAAVDASTMALGADYVVLPVPPRLRWPDVGTAAGHVGGNGDGSLAGTCDDFCLLLVILCVEHAMDDAVFLEHPRDVLADLDRHRAD